MKVGVLLVFQNWHQDLTDEEMFRSEIRLGEMAETLGYDSVWSVEHHFDDYSMCPDATQSLTYLAARTSTITLGTGAVILPRSACQYAGEGNADEPHVGARGQAAPSCMVRVAQWCGEVDRGCQVGEAVDLQQGG